ncbi:MAG: 30S ribosomal protein S9, partial [Elusimicrobiaceae bacterium]|nr:30S ribosomal protein S9 [Elusimicrobiaceae bacterium]
MNNTKDLKTGRRKTAVAQVALLKGKGNITVNTKSLDEYFGNHTRCKAMVKSPLVVTNTEKEYDVTARVNGGGVSAQAGALRHAIARSLAAVSEDIKKAVKKAGYLTRDPRMV